MAITKMNKNKKGIMVKFLLTIILAILIFAPTCLIASKFFRLSTQAKSNFNEFVNELKTLEEGKPEVSELILDKETAVVYFEPKQEIVKVSVKGGFYKGFYTEEVDYRVIFNKPSSCIGEKDCLCLFREAEINDEIVTSEGALCEKEINLNLKLNNCGIGSPSNVISYSCENGFVIERLLVKKATGLVYYEAPRRVPLQMKEEGNVIYLEELK